MATKHAVALRAFDHLGDSYAPGAAFPLDAGHLSDWSAPGVDLVREATSAEVAKVKGASVEKPARRAPAKRARQIKPATPVVALTDSVPADPVPADPDPAAPAA